MFNWNPADWWVIINCMLPLQNYSRFLHKKWRCLSLPFYDSLAVDLVWKRAFLEGEKSLPHHILPQSTNWRSFSAHYLTRQHFSLLKFRKKQWLVIYYSCSPKSSAICISDCLREAEEELANPVILFFRQKGYENWPATFIVHLMTRNEKKY